MDGQPKKYSIYAFASLITGLVSVFFFGGFYIGALSLILGLMAFSDIQKNNYKGRGVAIIGLFFAILAIVLPFTVQPRLNKMALEAKDKNIATHLQLIAWNLESLHKELENFRTVNNQYPAALSELIDSNPPYIPAARLDSNQEGYNYAYFPDETNFLIVATPTADSVLGPASFCIMEDSVIRMDKDGGSISGRTMCGALESIPKLEKDLSKL